MLSLRSEEKGHRNHSDMNGEEISCQGKELSSDSVGLLYSVLSISITQLPISAATELNLLAQSGHGMGWVAWILLLCSVIPAGTYILAFIYLS